MRTRFLLALGSLALAAAPTVAVADQSSAPLQLANVIALPPAPDSTRIHAVLSRADEATSSGRMGEARRLYRGLIQEQRDASQYAGTTIWKLASNLVYDGDVKGAALLLDDLAAEASRFGDPAMELRATFESAILWQKVKRNDLAMAHLDRVRCLLQSPAIAAEVKQSIERRIVG